VQVDVEDVVKFAVDETPLFPAEQTVVTRKLYVVFAVKPVRVLLVVALFTNVQVVAAAVLYSRL
jgi:hypothetical protein